VPPSGTVDSLRRAPLRLRDAAFTAKKRPFLTRRCGNATYYQRPNDRSGGRVLLRAGFQTRPLGADRSSSA